ncbi:MAG TPA: tryptophan-rich sensory protein [Candidatus Paceibacterota bacterium]|jgi:tryptophan-rich sensory protein|nr:tryptophan-rich sensory protein [Candidatus Paceibacterota bacterium]HPT40052.1 tryptophan-rich sensory protein [Candidatus Paceibacterota bacterium]
MLKINYIIIPLITIFVSVCGSWVVGGGMIWYRNLQLPSIVPEGYIIGIIWTIIFILSAISALLFYNKFPRNNIFKWVVFVFLLNAFLNIFWNFLFFGWHLLVLSFIEMILLELTVVALIFFLWRKVLWAGILLIPYALWVPFATYLTWSVIQLN